MPCPGEEALTAHAPELLRRNDPGYRRPSQLVVEKTLRA